MLSKLRIRNFKRFDQLEVALGNPVLLLGPNDSGKSTVMQALSLWETGLRRWLERHSRARAPADRPGVTLNRRDLVSMPVPRANLLWKDLRLRDVGGSDGWQATEHVRIEIVVEGTGGGSAWECGLEFDYANEDLIYCRPLRADDGPDIRRIPVPEQAAEVRTAFLPSISGLAPSETLLAPGTVGVRIGEGRTAEVLRNLCLAVWERQPEDWNKLVGQIRSLFGATVDPPRYQVERGEITVAFRDGDLLMDISSAGRGFHQLLLVLSFMYARPGTVLLLDEPAAHLEPSRQRQSYRAIREVSRETGSQVIISTHSGVLLDEALDQDLVLAFVGKPRQIGRHYGERAAQALREIGFEDCMQAEQAGWVLYLSGPADLSALRAFARRLGHERAVAALQRPFVRYLANSGSAAERHFGALATVLPEVRGCALLDSRNSDDSAGSSPNGPVLLRWSRGRLEDYVLTPAALEAYAVREARSQAVGPLFAPDQAATRRHAMREAIDSAKDLQGEHLAGSRTAHGGWAALEPVFRLYRQKLGLGADLPLPDAADLVEGLPDSEIDAEIREKLDAIVLAAEGVGD